MPRSAYTALVFALCLSTAGSYGADPDHTEVDSVLRPGQISRREDDTEAAAKALTRAKAFIKATGEVPKDAWAPVERAAVGLLTANEKELPAKASDFVRELNESAAIGKLREDARFRADDELAKELAKRLQIDLTKVTESKSLEKRQLDALKLALAAVPRPTATPTAKPSATATPGAKPSLIPGPLPAKESLQPAPPPSRKTPKTPPLTGAPITGNPLVPGTPGNNGGGNNGGGNDGGANNGGANGGANNGLNNGGNPLVQPQPDPTIDPNAGLDDLDNGAGNNNGFGNDGNNNAGTNPGLGNNNQTPPEQQQQQQPQLPSPGSPGEHAQNPGVQPVQVPDGKLQFADIAGPIIQAAGQLGANTGLSDVASKAGPREPNPVSWKAVEGLVSDVWNRAQSIMSGFVMKFQAMMGASRPMGQMPGSALTGVGSQIGGLGEMGRPPGTGGPAAGSPMSATMPQ